MIEIEDTPHGAIVRLPIPAKVIALWLWIHACASAFAGGVMMAGALIRFLNMSGL